MFGFLFNPDLNEEECSSLMEQRVDIMCQTEVRLSEVIKGTERISEILELSEQAQDILKKRRAPQKYTDMYLCKGER